MIEHPYSEDVTIVPPDCMAVIVARDGETQFCVPKGEGSDLMPEPWLALTEVAMRFMGDPEWVAEMIDEFKARMGSHQ